MTRPSPPSSGRFLRGALVTFLVFASVLVAAPATASTPPHYNSCSLDPCPAGLRWFFRGALSTGIADRWAVFGDPGDVALGVGTTSYNPFTETTTSYDVPTVYRGGVFWTSSMGISYGDPGDIPLAGDWLGSRDGDRVGVFREGTFYLEYRLPTELPPGAIRNGGAADNAFAFGAPGDVPIVGDWNGDGIDTVGYQRGNAFVLRNSNSAGDADTMFTFGNPGDTPLVGDWNGDGIDTVGVFRGGAVYLRNSHTTGVADIAFNYGDPADAAIAGSWQEWNRDTVAVLRYLPAD